MKSIEEFIQDNKALAGYKALAWTEDQVKTFWDFESLNSHQYFTFQFADKIISLITPYLNGKKSILDYGAGKGFLTSQLLKEGYNTAAFDLSTESAKILRDKFQGKAEFLGSYSGKTIAEQVEKFDAIVMIEVIEHLNDHIRVKILKQINSLLKPGGVLVISSPNNENLSEQFICNPNTREIFHRWQHVYSWTGDSLAAEIEKFDFKIVKKIETKMKYVGSSPFKKIRKLLAKPEKLSNLFVIAQKK